MGWSVLTCAASGLFFALWGPVISVVLRCCGGATEQYCVSYFEYRLYQYLEHILFDRKNDRVSLANCRHCREMPSARLELPSSLSYLYTQCHVGLRASHRLTTMVIFS